MNHILLISLNYFPLGLLGRQLAFSVSANANESVIEPRCLDIINPMGLRCLSACGGIGIDQVTVMGPRNIGMRTDTRLQVVLTDAAEQRVGRVRAHAAGDRLEFGREVDERDMSFVAGTKKERDGVPNDSGRRCHRCMDVCDGTYTPELAASLKEQLADVFNRGFWEGYYQGAYMGQWSAVYGSQAKRNKVYCGKVTNWFARIGVAEIQVESAPLHSGDSCIVIGPSTGVVEFTADDIRVDYQPVQEVAKGVACSVALPGGERLRRGDKLYLWVEREPIVPASSKEN